MLEDKHGWDTTSDGRPMVHAVRECFFGYAPGFVIVRFVIDTNDDGPPIGTQLKFKAEHVEGIKEAFTGAASFALGSENTSEHSH